MNFAGASLASSVLISSQALLVSVAPYSFSGMVSRSSRSVGGRFS